MPQEFFSRLVATPTVETQVLAAELEQERESRARAATWGSAGMGLSAVMASGISVVGETVQNEQAQQPGLGTGGIFDILANAPFDWKAAILVAGTYAVLMAAPDVAHKDHIEIDNAVISGRYRSGESGYKLADEVHTSRLMRRVTHGIVTVIAGYAAYKLGEHGSLQEDTIIGGGLWGLALVGIGRSKLRARRGLRATN